MRRRSYHVDEKAIINLACRLLLREEAADPENEDVANPAVQLGEPDPRVQVFLDRVLLRFFGSPSVVVYLRDARANPNGVIELVFSELPQEIIPKIAQIVGVPDGKAFAFHNEKTQYPCTGYRFKPRDEDLEGIKL